MPTKVIISPGKYIQGPGEIKKLETHTRPLGDKPFVIGSESGLKRINDALKMSYDEAGVTLTTEAFRGNVPK